MHINPITKTSKEAHELLGIAGDDALAFHEVRSLSKRTCLEQGNVDTKGLCRSKPRRKRRRFMLIIAKVHDCSYTH